MVRNPNAVDFWRGFALLTIFINHIPGIYFERLTYRNLTMSDSADLFVFLAGWGLRLMLNGAGTKMPESHLLYRLGARAVTLYAAQMLMMTIALAMLAVGANLLENSFILEWNNAAEVFSNPVNAHIGLALLTHQLGYFDILPLYVTLMLLAPLIGLIHIRAPQWLLSLSAAIYLLALVFEINFRTWPANGEWFFNPLCWQFLFILGFVLAVDEGPGRFVRRYIAGLRVLAVPVLVIGTWIVWTGWWPDLSDVPNPKLLFLISKTYITPVRLIQFLALAAIFSVLFPYVLRWLPRMAKVFSMLGRNSLNVFCVGSLLSLAAQIVRYALQGGIVLDAAIIIVGFLLLGLTAWLSEWRDRVRANQA